MKKIYFTPNIKVEAVEAMDVITTSDGLAYVISHGGDQRSWSEVFGNSN